MHDAAPPAQAVTLRDVRTMARYRAVQLRNAIDQQLRDAPVRTLCVIALLCVIWSSLYFLLLLVLRQVRNWGLVALVADSYIFVHFFLVLAVMLTFSNGILAFSTLYGRGEAGHLLSLPANPRQIVFAKWLESVFLSSWSFLLLGVPLMLAVSSSEQVHWSYYPLFLGHFVGFVIMPACLGLLAACAVALWAPRRPMTIVVLVSLVGVGLAINWVSTLSHTNQRSDEWLFDMLRQLAGARQTFLPSTWTAMGIGAAARQDTATSLYYLFIVLGNAMFASWLTINLLAASWPLAYSRSAMGRFSPLIRRGWMTQAACAPLRLVLPSRVYYVLLKDVRHFARDAKQWTQMLIMLGLLLIYVLNLQRMPLDPSQPGAKALMTFLNLTTISLILATFTSRFVFPLISLESQQLWILGLLPVARSTLLLLKFGFALTITSLAAGGVMALAVLMLDLPPLWVGINFAVCASICVGLSGLAVGLGARFPVLGQRNPARIAAGFGGTLNLIASMLFVALEMAGVATLSLTEFRAQRSLGLPESLTSDGWWILAGLVALGFVVAGGALSVGAAHFRRLEA